MGSFLSLLLGEAEEEGALSLLELLDVDDQQQQQDADNNDNNQHDANRLNWNLILRRLRTHPEEAAAYCHSIDPSPLIRCLSCLEPDIPTAVIRAFLDAYDDTVYHSDREGLTPLLAAVRRTAVVLSSSSDNDEEEEEEIAKELARQHAREITQLLLEANPEAVRQADNTGKLPLHYCRTDMIAAERIVNAFPEAVHQVDKEQGRLPLHYYCCLAPEKEDEQEENDNNNVAEATAPQALQLALPNPEVARLLVQSTTSNAAHPVLCKDKSGLRPIDILWNELITVLQTNDKEEADIMALDTLWEVLTILVQSVVIASPFQMVHALVSLRCPAVVMAEALRRFPQQAVERDVQGRTPLLMAVGMLDHKRSSQRKDADMCQVICELLKCNSTAARMLDREGRLAIDALAESGVFDEQLYECIVKAEPRAVDTRDLKNKQHPFVTAALAGPDKANVSSVYHLLRAKPHVISYYCLD